MSHYKKVRPGSRAITDTGFSNTVGRVNGRFINKDGSYNLRKEGGSFFNRFSLYQRMLSLPRWKFIAIILAFYFASNLLFTWVYLLIGTDQIQGLVATSAWGKFKEVYFFSTQTFTTVGYGRMNPMGDAASFVASIEALTGFLSFAIATGLLYGRFTRPKAYLVFSDNALVSPYRDGRGLMFRFACYKDYHSLTDVEVKVNMGLLEQDNGKEVYRYYNLNLEQSKIDTLPMNWTVVHPLDTNSPIEHFTEDDMKTSDIELYVQIRGFDEIFSATVVKRVSYTYDEVLFNRKFKPMYRESEEEGTTILELHKINDFVEV